MWVLEIESCPLEEQPVFLVAWAFSPALIRTVSMVPRTYLTLFSLLLILSQGVFQCITHYLRDKFIFIICVPGDAQEFYIILLHSYNKPIITLFSFPKIEIGFDHIQSLTYYCRSTSALYNSTIQVFKTSVPHNPVQIPHQCLLPQSFPRLKKAR